tara:strand:+ start:762 stop:1670 length:909 start_codon:yes stop_codon:yes gene_type:complete
MPEVKIPIEELREKKIFVATPMYGGMCSGMYSKACCDLATLSTKYQMDLKFFYLFNESLIPRARNYLVDEFLRAEEYTHLMFIDADIHFDPNDVLTLAALDKDIIGGPYPKKCIAWEKVRNAVDTGLADEDPTVLEQYTGDYVFNPVENTHKIQVAEPVDVLEIGTGFMLIKREVFDDFKEAYPQFTYTPDHNRSEHFSGDREIHAYFDTVIDSDAYLGEISGKSNRYLSEDYFFCQFVRRLGYKIYLCPWMKLGHMGSYVFSGSMQSLANLEFAAHGMDKESRVSGYEKRKRNRGKRKKKG